MSEDLRGQSNLLLVRRETPSGGELGPRIYVRYISYRSVVRSWCTYVTYVCTTLRTH